MSITVQQPQAYDIIGDTLQIAGVAGGAFEAEYVYRIVAGSAELTGHFMASGPGNVGGHHQFQTEADLSGAAFHQVVAFLEVFHVSPKDGSIHDRAVVPVILGRQIMPDYTAYHEHRVRSGETLWSIAQHHYGNSDLHHRLVVANPSITNPNLISVGQVIRVPKGH